LGIPCFCGHGQYSIDKQITDQWEKRLDFFVTDPDVWYFTDNPVEYLSPHVLGVMNAEPT
jgi:hypothetical protein